MRNLLLTSAALMGLAAGGAMAQTSNAQSPPAPRESSQPPQPTNSLPAGGATTTSPAPGATLNATPAPAAPRPATPVTPAPAPLAAAPAPAAPLATTPAAVASAPPAHPMRHPMRHAAMRRPMKDGMAPADAADQSAPPTEAYRGGAGSPLSTRATDLTAAPGERMGSRLPTPASAGNDPHDLLIAAGRSLDRGQTGAAQQALEMAETRVLSRTIDPSMASQPDQASMVQNIAMARRALGSRDTRGAKQAIAAALQSNVPPPGPAVTMVPGTPATTY